MFAFYIFTVSSNKFWSICVLLCRAQDSNCGDSTEESQQDHGEESESLTETKITHYDAENIIALSGVIETNSMAEPEKHKMTREEDKNRLHIQLQSAEEKVQRAQSEVSVFI